jgi:hypothetical protein
VTVAHGDSPQSGVSPSKWLRLRVVGVRWLPAQANGEDREDAGDDVARGLDARGDEAERAGGDAGTELENDEHSRRGDGDHAVRDWPLASAPAGSRIGVRVLLAAIW